MICFRTPAALQSGLTPRRVTRTLQTLAAVRPAPARYHGITAPAIRSEEHARTPGIVMNVMGFSDCRRQFGDLPSSRAVSRFRVRPTPPFFSVARFSVVLCGHPRHAAVSVLAGEERQMDDWQRNGLNGSGVLNGARHTQCGTMLVRRPVSRTKTITAAVCPALPCPIALPSKRRPKSGTAASASWTGLDWTGSL